MNYEQLFKNALLKEEAPVNVSPQDSPVAAPEAEPQMSDSDTWTQNNAEIAGNEELGKKFDVDGLDKAEIEKYSEIINKWGSGIQTAIEQLAQIIKFAAGEKLAEAPGSEQFSALIKDSPRLKRDLSAFKSQIEDLEQTVKLAINDDAKERKTKIDSLNK
jgi:hypothetical protein